MERNGTAEPAVRPKIPIIRGPEKDSQRSSSKPVDMKTISVFDEDGNKRHLPALHPSFVHPLDNFTFLPLPTVQNADHQIRKPIDDIISRITEFETNLHNILRLPYHRFWSTVIYDKAMNMGLRSYINNTPRFYLGQFNLDERVVETANTIHKLVLKVYLRLSTIKECPKNYMSQEYFGKILMERKIFDIPLLMDLCAIYGNIYQTTNEQLSQLLNRILESHPHFSTHLQSSVDLARDKLTKITDELGLSGMDNRVVVNSQQTHVISTLNWSHIVGVIEHIVGTIVPLSFFLSLSPIASKVYRKNRFDTVLVEFYDSVFPKLKEELNSRFAKDTRAKKSTEIIIRQLTIARCCLVNVFRSMVKFSSLDPLLDPKISMDEKTVLTDEFLDMASIAASSSCFSKDYISKYSFESDIYVLMEKSDLTGFGSVDPSRIDYLFNVMSEGGTVNETNRLNKEINIPTGKSEIGDSSPSQKTRFKQNQFKNGSTIQEDNSLDNAKLASLISHIKDFFPDLNNDIIENLLQMNEYDPERVIDLISTEEIPLNLR